MAADDFFARWNKRKAQAVPLPAASAPAADPAIDAVAGPVAGDPPAATSRPLPTLADVEGLTAESDYAAFFAKGVDETVRRSAMKKLFALPQFNIMDGLDIYVGDYSQPDPLPPGMLESLLHARDALNPAQFFSRPVSQLLDLEPEPAAEPAAEPAPDPLAATPAADVEAAADAAALPLPDLPANTPSDTRPAAESLPAAVAPHKNEAV